MSYQPYPRRLYLGGEPTPGDEHALNSVVVESYAEELEQNARGYSKFDVIAKKAQLSTGGSSGSPGPASSPPQGKAGAAPGSADPIEELRAHAKSLGLKVHHKAGAESLRKAIASAMQ